MKIDTSLSSRPCCQKATRSLRCHQQQQSQPTGEPSPATINAIHCCSNPGTSPFSLIFGKTTIMSPPPPFLFFLPSGDYCTSRVTPSYFLASRYPSALMSHTNQHSAPSVAKQPQSPANRHYRPIIFCQNILQSMMDS